MGRPLSSLVTDESMVSDLLERCRDAAPEEFERGVLRYELSLAHQYLPGPVPCICSVTLAGAWWAGHTR